MKELKSVRIILVVASFVAMLALSIVISTIGYVNTKEMVLHNIQNEVGYITNEGKLLVENWLERKKAEVELLAENISVGNLNPDTVNSFLENEKRLVDDSYSSFWLSDLDGNWYSYTGRTGSIAE